MTNLFVYGTLRHIPLLEIVLGRTEDLIDFTHAELPDHAAMAAVEGPFPLIVAQQGYSISCIMNNVAKLGTRLKNGD